MQSIIKEKFPLFLPNVTHTFTSSANLLTDSNIRLSEARKALFYTISKGYFDKIVIVDGSNQELLSLKEIADYKEQGIKIEQLVFMQDISLVKKYGKSHGEMQITNFMIRNSELVKDAGGFVKISPRYIFDNIDKVLPKIIKEENIFFIYNPYIIKRFKSFACSIIYKSTISFYYKYIYNQIDNCSNEVDGFLETILFNELCKHNRKSMKISFPHFSGIAGTTGKSISNRYFLIRNIFSKLGFLCHKYEV